MGGSSSMKKIFIVGNSRSGTTMLGRVFGIHSQVHTFGELHFFEHQVDAATVSERSVWDVKRRIALLERLLTTSRDGFFAKVAPGAYRTEVEHILSNVTGEDPVSAYESFLCYETQRNGKVIPCEQTPRYLFFVKEILDALPDVFVINMVRDPRDVLLSQKNKWRRRFLGAKNIPLREAFRAWVNYHPYTIAKLWVAAVRTAAQFEGHPRFISIRFEDLLLQPEATVVRLCEFAGIDFEPGMLGVPQVGSSTGHDRPERRGIDGDRSGRWRRGRLTAVELDICQQVAGAEMRGLGYATESVPASMWKYWGSMGLFVVKGLMALLLNLGRTKNLRETLKRRFGKQGA